MTVSAASQPDANALTAAKQYHKGSLTTRTLEAMLGNLADLSAFGAYGKIQRVTVTIANNTAQTAVSAACRVIGIRAENFDNDAVHVVLANATGASALRNFQVWCPAGAAGTPGVMEAIANASDTSGSGQGAGVPFSGGVFVRAFKASDGTTAADGSTAANGCNVTVYYLL